MIKAQIYIEKDRLFELKELAKKENTGYSNLVRKAIDEFIKQKKKGEARGFDFEAHAKKYAKPLGGDISQNIDEILYGSGWDEEHNS